MTGFEPAAFSRRENALPTELHLRRAASAPCTGGGYESAEATADSTRGLSETNFELRRRLEDIAGVVLGARAERDGYIILHPLPGLELLTTRPVSMTAL